MTPQKRGIKNINDMATFAMILITFIWGYGFITTKYAVDCLPSPQLLFYRFTLSALVMVLIFHKSVRTVTKEELKKSAIVGVYLFLGFLLQTEAINHTTVAKNSFLTTLNVIFVPIIVAAVHKKKIDKYSIFGCILAVIGTGVLSLNADFSLNFGDILSIACALSFALHIFWQGVYTLDTRTEILVTYQIIFAAVFAFFSSAMAGTMTFAPVPIKGALGIVYLALLSTCFAFFVQTYYQKFMAPTKAVIIFSLEAVFASFFAAIIFKDPVTPRFLIGSACIFVAVIVSSTKLEFLKIRRGASDVKN